MLEEKGNSILVEEKGIRKVFIFVYSVLSNVFSMLSRKVFLACGKEFISVNCS